MDVRSLRIERGWTQEELASRAGLSTRTVQRIERGGRANLASLQALTAAFGMAGQELLHYDLPVPPVSRRCALGLGTLLILPALLFVAVNVIRYSLGFSQVPDIFGPLFEIEWISVISPFIFVGGAGAALLLNVFASLGVKLVVSQDALIPRTLVFYPSFASLGFVALASALLAVLVGYAVLENLGHLATISALSGLFFG